VRAFFENDRQFSDDFKSSFMLAIALHICLLLLGFVISLIFKPSSDDAALEILKASVRVDIVGMPKMTIEELKRLELPSEVPQEPGPQEQAAQEKEVDSQAEVKADDVVMPSETKPKKALSSFLQSYSSKKVEVKSPSKNGQGKKINGLDSLILEGNKLSKGTALFGDTTDMADSAFVGYVQIIPEKVKEHWKLPSFLKDQNLQCRIHVWVGPRGEILKINIRESSGNSEYDSRALNAIKAVTLGVPPAEIVTKLSSRGIILGFPL
jgi:TonB family protein